jgi:hypothetical protein
VTHVGFLRGSEPHVAGAGDVDVNQGIEQPDPFAPELQELLVLQVSQVQLVLPEI